MKRVQVPIDDEVYSVLMEIKKVSGVSCAKQLSDLINSNHTVFVSMLEALLAFKQGDTTKGKDILAHSLGSVLINIGKDLN